MAHSDKLSAIALTLSVLGAIACFALGHAEAGMMLVVFATGHILPSPLRKRGDDANGDAAD